ncbi:hypothetical protein RYX36_000639, partial [Vicia faba]
MHSLVYYLYAIVMLEQFVRIRIFRVEVAEKLGLMDHVVEEGELMKKSKEIMEAIVKNNQDLLFKYKSMINDGIKLDLGHALSLEK